MGREVTLLAVSVIALVLFISVGLFFGFWAQDKKVVSTSYSVNSIHLDYMHAQTCGYCQYTKRELEVAVGQLQPYVSLSVWNESLRGQDSATTAIYQKYKNESLFGGFPTIVANGEDMLVGKRNSYEIKRWICSHFENEPPECIESK